MKPDSPGYNSPEGRKGLAWLNLAVLLPVLLLACHTDAGSDIRASAETEERRKEILKTAYAYALHEWKATEDNRMHGVDEDGVRVDTPDRSYRPGGWRVDGGVNVGIPYKWGGFSSLEEFDRGLAAGMAAGDLTDGRDLADSGHAVGVDCSGLIARCWGLPFKESTRSLGRLILELDDFGELRPGDLINKPDVHAMLFAEFVGDERQSLRVIEADTPRVMVNVYSVEALKRDGFRPFRYKPLDERWVNVETGPASMTLPEGSWQAAISASNQVDLDAVPDLLSRAVPGDWTRYQVTDNGQGGISMHRVVARAEPGIEVQTTTDYRTDQLQTMETHSRAMPLSDRLLAMLELGEEFKELKITENQVTSGEWVAGQHRLPAHRVRLKLDGHTIIRGQTVEMTVQIDAIISPSVSMEGVVRLEQATEARTTDWRKTAASTHELVSFRSNRDSP